METMESVLSCGNGASKFPCGNSPQFGDSFSSLPSRASPKNGSPRRIKRRAALAEDCCLGAASVVEAIPLPNSKEVPLVSEDTRSRVVEKNYAPGRKSKALALSPRAHAFWNRGSPTQDEAARRVLEACGESEGVPCMIVAVDDVFVVPIPTMMKAVGFFQTVGNALIAPGSRDGVARRLAIGTSGWSAVATGANGLTGVVSHAGSEQDAIQGALADCSGHDHGCRIIAIGPFSVAASEVGKAP